MASKIKGAEPSRASLSRHIISRRKIRRTRMIATMRTLKAREPRPRKSR